MPSLGQHLISRLKSAGVDHAFGYPGDYILSFYDQLHKSNIDLITTTCERNAGIAADAYSRINGIGCAVVTYCVGGFNLIDAVGCAYAEKSPLIIVSGAPGIKERDSEFLPHHLVKEFACQSKIFSEITCASTVLTSPATACYEIDRVINACKFYKQPVYIEVPRDMVDKPISYDAWEQGTPPSFISDEETLTEAIEETTAWINEAKNPIILAGVEVARFNLGSKLMKFAERINVPIATTILGKSVINERHPLSLGVFCGPLAHDRCAKLIGESDCLIMLGVEMTDVSVGFLPKKIIRRNAVIASCNEITIRSHGFRHVGFCDFFNKLFEASFVNRRPLEVICEKENKTYTSCGETKITTKRLFEKLDSVITAHMTIVADVGDSMFGSSGLTVSKNHFLSPAFYNSMGFAIPGSLGAQFAAGKLHTKSRCLVVVGDGSFQQTSNELSTIVARNLNPIVVVLNNGGFLTERFFKQGSYNDIRNWNYHNFTEVLGGGQGRLVSTEKELDCAIAEALVSKALFIINVVLDKNDASPALTKVIGELSTKM